MTEKKKLTLSVDKEIVEKAKKLGINISEITESVLRHVSETKTKDVVTKKEVDQAYQRLFKSILPAIKEYGAHVAVGFYFEEDGTPIDHVYLRNDGSFIVPALKLHYMNFSEALRDTSVGFTEPKRILSDLIDALIKASEDNKETLKELEIFRRVIEALTDITVPPKKE